MAATFSYAAAAKGMVTATTPSASPEPSKTAEQTSESSPQTSTETVTAEAETPVEAEQPAATAEKASEPTAAATTTPDVSGPSSSDGASNSTVPKDEDSSNTPNGTSESTWDKQSQASTTEKPNGEAEGAKEKSDSTEEKEKNVPPPKELKAAPLPTVNIWHQRREAQDAKAKAIAALKPATSGNKVSAKTASTASSTSGDNQQELSKAASKKKDAALKKADGNKGRDDGSRKSGSRSSRQVQANGHSADSNPPPVGDAALWPTPQVAQGEEKKKAQEKTEKSDKAEKSPAARSHGKEKWMPVPYVPTAVFTTPLPSAGRRGGRTARGGRDGGRSGAHGAGAAAADKAPAGQVAQNATAKQASSAERGRGEPNTARANSLPANSRRANSADAGKAPQAADRSRGAKGAEDVNGAPSGKQTNGDFPRHHGKGFARNQDGAHKGNAHLSVDSHARSHRFENGPKSADFAGFHGDHKDNKEHHRESRAERGRGSHRGRGGHSGFNGSQNSHFPNNHMSHQSFVHPKSFGFSDRQRSQNLPNGSQHGHKMTFRSPSLPNSGAMYGVYPFPAEINTMYGYQQIPAGPMTAVPYQQYMEPFSLMNMISMQLEYYFSVDNLCKDLFLRKHMDSQGYVNLAFIAGFKRIKTLTEDFELLRHVGRQLRTVECYVGEDGVDRLRPREKWEQWVFPIEQRDPSAQNEGPPPFTHAGKPEDTQNHVDGLTNGSALPNGTGVSKTPLSSAAPEFSPSKPIPAQNEVANRAE